MEDNLFVRAMAPAMARDNRASDDYTDEEGLRVCGKCHTRKQTYFEVDGLIPRTAVPCLCQCEQERMQLEEGQRKREQAAQRIDSLRRKGLADAQYTACLFSKDDGTDAKAGQICRKYVDQWEWAKENNAGLILWGDVGGGKTFFAGCIANALIDKGVAVMMTSIPRLIAAMSKDFGDEQEDILRKIADVPLLVLDDVGTERSTPYGMEKAYEIINTRYKAKKPLIVTTNLTMAELRNVTEVNYKRLYGRIVEMCAPCKVTADGRRQKAAQEKYDEMKARFGLE